MKTPEDHAWEKLLIASTSSFAGEAVPPYGFVTSTLAQLRATQRQQNALERLGWRALLASLGMLAVVATLTFGMNFESRSDLDPGITNIIDIGNVPLS